MATYDDINRIAAQACGITPRLRTIDKDFKIKVGSPVGMPARHDLTTAQSTAIHIAESVCRAMDLFISDVRASRFVAATHDIKSAAPLLDALYGEVRSCIEELHGEVDTCTRCGGLEGFTCECDEEPS